MSDGKQFFQAMAAGAAANAPAMQKAGAEIKAELGRMATHGAFEAANALFNGQAFVLYGPGQQPADVQYQQSRGRGR